MKIINLIEDTQGESGLLHEHGLSFYIEIGTRKILLDTGASGAFLSNAEALGVDLSEIDTVIISHGHYDHTGGLRAFAAINPHAEIYLLREAFGDFYNHRGGQEKYIGMDPAIKDLPQAIILDRAHMTDRCFRIDEGVTLFAGVSGTRLVPRGNGVLCRKVGDKYYPDVFDHEQYAAVTEGDTHVLLSGCAHRGILNILDTYRALFGQDPTHVISGFHTTLPHYDKEDVALIQETAAQLARMDTVFWTGHCTGEYPLTVMEAIMGEKLQRLHSGVSIPPQAGSSRSDTQGVTPFAAM